MDVFVNRRIGLNYLFESVMAYNSGRKVGLEKRKTCKTVRAASKSVLQLNLSKQTDSECSQKKIKTKNVARVIDRHFKL